MQPRRTFVYLAALCAAALAMPAPANCGLNVNPAALDRNHNARLSRGEVYGSPLASVFDRVDTNNNGFISEPEYADRCYSLQASTDNSGWHDSPVGERVQRQQQRQQNRINDRVNRESNDAADNVVDKAMGALFGD